VIPFTAKKEGNQSKTSGAILLLFALTMLFISTIDLSWLGAQGSFFEFLRNLSQLSNGTEMKDLREPLIAMLLIFPTALYAQFFQTRPKERLGVGVQLSTFAALSLVFALPVIPAAFVAIGWSSVVVSVACVSTAIIGVIMAVLVIWMFSNKSLLGVRVREAELTLRDISSGSPMKAGE
jgi:hypothetical protein